jgi:translation initiation factor 3 subunit B
MAPSFDTLSDHDFQEEDDEEEIDFSDLREQYDVRMEEGLDTFCVFLRIAVLRHLADG